MVVAGPAVAEHALRPAAPRPHRAPLVAGERDVVAPGDLHDPGRAGHRHGPTGLAAGGFDHARSLRAGGDGEHPHFHGLVTDSI